MIIVIIFCFFLKENIAFGITQTEWHVFVDCNTKVNIDTTCIYFSKFYGKVCVVILVTFPSHLKRNYALKRYFEPKSWIVGVFSLMKKCHKSTFLVKISV